jgi:uncharacterized radical SAM protein YgiQ
MIMTYSSTTSNSEFLPVTLDEMKRLGWEQADIIIVSGDAYVDHPSFGAAVMGRMAEKMGLRVAILPQPNWRDDLRDFRKLGAPRLFFGVTAGSMDSMINHYTALRRKRSNDAYTPGGRAGYRPDHASVVYSQVLKKLFPDIPVILGGVEASMRRFTHYDYWQDKVKPSVLIESGADLLLYGMAEQAWKMIINLMNKGVPVSSLHNIPQTAFARNTGETVIPLKDTLDMELASHEECLHDKSKFAEAFRITEETANSMKSIRFVQKSGKSQVLVNPPFPPADEKTADEPYDLPYTRLPHPKYHKKPPIPAWEMIKFSVNIHRGCFGGCSFCAINSHQGKFVVSRSEQSIIHELEKVSRMPGFKGHISDLGGPSANMYKMKGIDQEICSKCKRPSCIFPATCKNLDFNHKPLINLYDQALKVQGIKKITIGSGVRYDMLMGKTPAQNREFGLDTYTRKLLRSHVSGRLKVAPEHTSDHVLKLMRKPSYKTFESFHKKFREICAEENLPWQLIPYFISGHPGCFDSDMEDLRVLTRKLGYNTEQVQEFTPTPMTLATTMYYTGLDPYTGKKVFVVRGDKAKRKQKDYFFGSR